MKLYKSIFILRLRKYLIEKFFKYADVPFEIAHTEISSKYTKPSNCEILLASFDLDNRHWIIYLKK